VTLPPTENVIQFGPFALDLGARQLTRKGVKIRLAQQPIQVLSLLLERPGQIVSREEFRRLLWQSDVFVDFDHGLNKSIQKLREALGDPAGSPRYIETIPRVGYRFVGPVNETTETVEGKSNQNILQPQELHSAPQAEAAERKRRRWVVIAACIAVAAMAGGWLTLRRLRASDGIQSLAVLPLDNLSGDSSQDYFADGMTDELITMLAKDSTLRIVSRTSVMQYRGAHRPLKEIARELHADAIVEGSVSRSKGRVHLTLQLIRANTDSHLWAENYERDADDVALPEEASKAIASKLDHTAPMPKPVRYVNPAAHDAYMRGMYLWFGKNMEESGAWFRKAIEIQPDYAAAWAGLADYYGEGVAGGTLDPRLSLGPMEEAAKRSLQLDPNLAQAHQAMAATYLIAKWDAPNASREIEQAIRLDPESSELYYLRACVQQYLRQDQEAIASARKSDELAPTQRPGAVAGIMSGAHQYDAALDDLRLRLQGSPHDPELLFNMADVWRNKGNYQLYAEFTEKGLMEANNSDSAASLRRAWQLGGLHAFVREQLRGMNEWAKVHYVSPVCLAQFHAMLGEKAQALDLLDEGLRQRSTDMLWVADDSAFDFLQNEPRFRTLIQSTGRPPRGPIPSQPAAK
jgi:TolB-like protein/DNA-binding winged helix-turn-helix (wHTH) protein